jgi:hypothetical protein
MQKDIFSIREIWKFRVFSKFEKMITGFIAKSLKNETILNSDDIQISVFVIWKH